MKKITLFLIMPSFLSIIYFKQIFAQDWVITGTEIVENDTRVMNGNLIVKAGGSLTLRNVHLQLNIHHNAEYNITTEPGSSLFIYDSDIRPSDSSYVYQFFVNGSKFIFKNNTLQGAGFSLNQPWSYLGLSIFESDSVIVADNTIYHTMGSGITLDFCRYATVSGNIVTNNKRGSFGIALRNSQGCSISNNALSNQGESIFLQQNTYGCIISDNTVTNVGYCIILRHGVGYNIVINNKLSNALRGIWLQQAPFPNKIQNNDISTITNEGIYVEYATGSIIADNTISQMVSSLSKMGGIFISRSSDSYILNNTVKSSPEGGITLFSSSLSSIQGNKILNSKYGIGLWYDSDSNNVSNNILIDNDRNIIVDLSKENFISHNHFEGGSPNGYDNSNSFWNSNYWSDFKGWNEGLATSTAPYLISSNGIDINPLVFPPSIQNAIVPDLNIPRIYPFIEYIPNQDPITVPTVWENQTIMFSGGWKLYILSGASLTMNNVTLLGASPSTAEPEIVVDSGAQLNVNNSSIIGGELDHPLAINVGPGGVCEIRNSLLKNLGGEEGVTLTGNGSILENNRFEKCLWTITIGGTGNRAVNNVLDRCFSSITGDSIHNTVLGNDESETIFNFNKNGPSIFPHILQTLKSDTAKVSVACNNGTSLELNFKAGNISENQMSVTWFDKLIPAYYQKLYHPNSSLGFFHLTSNIRNDILAEMKFYYSDSSLIKSAIVNKTNLSFAYYDTVKGHWIKIKTCVDTTNNILSAYLNHFSLWGILIPDDSIFVDTTSILFTVSGTIVYANTLATPIGNVTVTLTPATGTALTATSSATGTYSIANVPAGTFTLTASKTGNWGGVTGGDALVVARHAAGITGAALTGLPLAAADVNNSGSVTGVDALLIVRRAVGLDSSFAAGDWVFASQQVVVASSPVIAIVSGLAMGDVNVSYTPSSGTAFAKSNAFISLNSDAVQYVASVGTFDVPVRMTSEMVLGAVSLKINFPTDVAIFEGITSKLNGVVSRTKDGSITIVWADMSAKNAMKFKANEALVSLKFSSKAEKGTVGISIDSWSELNDADGAVISMAKLSAPITEITNIPTVFSLDQNYPNPYNPSTTIQYGLPTRSSVRLVIYNVLGQVVKELVNTEQQAGYQSVFWNATVASGIYFYRLEATSKDDPSKRFIETKKMLLMR